MVGGVRRFALLLALCSAEALALPAVTPLQPPLRDTTLEGYRSHLNSLGELVRACSADAKACDPARVGDDDKVQTPGESFQERYGWLRSLLKDAQSSALKDRATLLDEASSRLTEELAGSGAGSQPQADFGAARQRANTILAQPEFRIVGGESWLDRKTAQFWQWFYRIFSATSEFGQRQKWLGPVLEWGFVGIAVVLVLVWVVRTVQRERLAISLGGAIATKEWQKESDDWAELARAEAAKGNWRDAIHCLFWASIVVLEGRKLWRRDETRTPREYVELLERNSPQQRALRSIARVFERTWYGLRDAGEAEYQAVLANVEELRRA